jgi:hypothetical protein
MRTCRVASMEAAVRFQLRWSLIGMSRTDVVWARRLASRDRVENVVSRTLGEQIFHRSFG